MDGDKYLTISEFSKISVVSRKALIYYDRIGLFHPDHVKENGYRYYSHQQIETITVINTLSKSGMPLEQIKRYLSECNPEKALALFRNQEKQIADQIRQLKSVQEMIAMRISLITEALEETEPVKVVEQDKVPFYISPPFHHHSKNIPGEIWVDFYDSCEVNGLSYGYPTCYVIQKQDITDKKSDMISHVGIRINNKKRANHFIRKGTCLIGFGLCHYGETSNIYSRLYDYIEKNNLHIAGNAYEEYLLDEVTTADSTKYKVKVTIPIEKIDTYTSCNHK